MKNLEVKYLGLTLNNPIIVSSSPFTSNIDSLLRCEEAGAGAVVLKSIFEEQVIGETEFMSRYDDYPEAGDYLKHHLSDSYLTTHLTLISEAKKRLSIPVIASINCSTDKEWISYAKRNEEAGADALELNIVIIPTSADAKSSDIERQYLDIVSKITAQINIPVSVKLFSKFTNILNIVKELHNRNIKGVVMFNKIIESDININTRELVASPSMSNSSELCNSLRTISLCSAEVDNIDIAVSTGVHTGEDAIKALLAGAKCVQICSTISVNGFDVINNMKQFISDWMVSNTHTSIDQFCGTLSCKGSENNEIIQRVQYLKYFQQ